MSRPCPTGTDDACWPDVERAALDDLRGLQSQSVLVVYDHVPRPESSGADLRLMQILEILARAGHRVTFIGRGASSPPSASAPLRELGIEVIAPDPERCVWEKLDAPRIDLPCFLSERRFDFALLYQYFWVGIGVAEQYVPLIRAHSPRTRVLLLSDDSHWLRELRRAERSGGRAELERSRGLRAKENFTYAAADLVLTITAEDAARMRADLPELDPEVVHFCQEDIPESVPGFESRAGLLFIGSGANDANVQAVRWFMDEAWPLVRAELPHAVLSIVGAPPARGWTPEPTPGVVVVGQASDLAVHVDAARVFVSPITYGTGLKTKNVQALGRGLPTVLTSISAEGMELHGDEAAFVRDDAAAFARAVVDLCTDAALWHATSNAALRHARKHFGRETTIRDLSAVLRRALASPARVDCGIEAGPGAVVELETEARRTKSRAALHVELARRCRAEGRFDEAKQAIRNVFCEMCCLPVDAPVYSQLHALLAVVYLASGEYSEAGLAAREALRLQPDLSNEPRETLERVLATVELKLADESVRAPESSSAECAARLEAGKVAFRAGDLDRAAECFLSVLGQDERCADAWNSLGVLMHTIGDRKEALLAFERAVRLSPDDPEARLNHAELARELLRAS